MVGLFVSHIRQQQTTLSLGSATMEAAHFESRENSTVRGNGLGNTNGTITPISWHVDDFDA